MNTNINIRKVELKKELINDNFTYACMINKMLDKGVIDRLISKITNTKTKVNVISFTNKSYLSGAEQFLYLLNNFVCYFKDEFYFIKYNSDAIIELLLQEEKETKYLLCKKYIGDNKYIDFYTSNTKKLIVRGFYQNLKNLSNKSELIKNFVKENKINFNKGIEHNNEQLENVYQALLKLAMCNAKTLNVNLLFETSEHYLSQITIKSRNNNANIDKALISYYINCWELMIKDYNMKKDAANILLK